jgi:hypothetical protein
VSEWHAMGTPLSGRRGRPKVGAVVAYARRAWEVRHVSDTDPSDDEEVRLARYVQPYRDEMQPYQITLRRLHGAKHERENSAGDIGLRVRAAAYHPFPEYPNGRVPLCSCHSHPWPCLEADQQKQAAKELREAEREMSLLPGCCPACQEPVTSRQRSITFGGPNVRNPLAEGPTFHLRSKCYGSAGRYEEAWVNAEPGRARSLLTLACAGTVIVHGDGTAECFGADNSDCPSVYAKHRCYSACYLQSHGCGRGCASAGHPGTRLAGRPADPRAVTRREPA